MKLSIKQGATSQSVNVFVRDSSSTTGAGLTGLVFNSAGLTAYYSHAGANATATAITLATLAAVSSAYSSGGFKEIDATNMPGWYRLDIPNACLAASKGQSVALHLKGATNMAPLPIEIELVAWDNQDTVRGGLTALPNAAAEAAGGLITRGTGTGQLSVTSGQVILQAGTGTGQLDFTSGVVKANITQLLGTAWLTPAVAGTPDVNAKQFGGAPVTATTSVTIPAASTLATTAGAVGSVTGAVGSVTGSVGSVAGAVGSVTAAVTVGTNNDKTGYTLSSAGVQAVWDALTSALSTVGSIGKRIVDNLDVVLSTRLATSGYTAPLSAADTRTAVGLASANLDTQLAALQADTDNLQTRIPAALTSGGLIKASVESVLDDIPSATALKRGVLGTVIATVGAASTTTSIVTSSMTPSASVTDQFKGRIVTFDKDTATAALRGQATDITASTAGGVLTVTALTTAPSSGDTFSIT